MKIDNLQRAEAAAREAAAREAPTRQATSRGRSWLRGISRQLARDTLYLAVGFPLAIVSCCVLLVGLALSVGMLPLFLLGIPVGYGTLRAARFFAWVERVRMRNWGRAIAAPEYGTEATSWLARFLGPMTQPQYWADVGFGIVRLPIAAVAWLLMLVAWVFPLALVLGVPATAILRPLTGEPVSYTFFTLTTSNPFEALPWAVGFGLLLFAVLPWVVHRIALAQVWCSAFLLERTDRRELSQRLEQVKASRAEVLESEARSMRKLERDIHDGPQQQLVRLSMDMTIARLRLKDDPDQVDTLLEEAQARVRETLAELRALTRGFAPPLLADRGLEAALKAVCARATIQAELDYRLASPPGAAAETTAYFVVSESLTNTAKHAEATKAVVIATFEGDSLVVVISDNGVGGAVAEAGGGLAGLRTRVEAHDGFLTVTSPAGGPTTVTARIPVTQPVT